LVLCCCEETEPSYFDGLKLATGSRSTKVKVGKSSDPNALVGEARMWITDDRYDQVWCVADVDQFDPRAAVQAADRLIGVELAISNPCFELWLLLHFEDWRRYEDACDRLADQLRRHVPTYEKRVEFSKLGDGVSQAVERAKRLNSPGNPSTNVWQLVELIVESGSRTAS
jgi:hypothetical protein